MIRILLALLLLLAPSAFAQTGRPEVAVATVADAIARGARTNEVLVIQNYSTNVSWPAPRTFIALPTTVITNAPDGVHYLTNRTAGLIYTSYDRFAMEQDASWFGASGNSTDDNTVALNAASAYTARYIDESSFTTLKGPGRGFLRIRPTPTGYIVTNTVYLQSSTEAAGAAIIYRGQKTNSVALAVGPSDYKNMSINNHVFALPDVWGYGDGFNATNSIGVSIRSIGRSTIRVGYVHRFETGIQLLGDGGWVFGNTFERGMTDACRYSLRLLATNSGFVNANTWDGLVLNNENPNYIPGYDTGYEMIIIDGTDGSINGNLWTGGQFEGFPGQRVIHILNASANVFFGQRWENHVMDYTSVDAQKLYMESESTVVGRGLNNRILWPSQGINGMAGVMVKETGASAVGNSGASSRWQHLRSSDTGDYHGPLVLDSSSPTSQGLAHLTVYPYMAWPDTHYSRYQDWVIMMTGESLQFKEDTDPTFKLYIGTDGSMIQSEGPSFLPQWKQQDGGTYYYDSANRLSMQLNRNGSLQWLNPTNGVSLGYIRAAHESFFQGLAYSEAPTNSLGGWNLGQNLDTGPKAWAGVDIVGINDANGDTVADSYSELAIGVFSTNHVYGDVQGGSGIYLNASTGSVARTKFTVALVPTNMHFGVTIGSGAPNAFRVDGSTTTGDTRLSAYDVDTSSLRRIRNTLDMLHFGVLNPNIAALAAATGGGAGKVLSYVNSTTFAWSNAPSSFSFSDLTNAILMGANMSAVYTSTNMTISSSGGGGATNGTSVSVDGGVALGSANFADGSRVGFSASGTNVSADIVANSIRTNELATAAVSYLLDRGNHTGTQAWSTLTGTPTTLSGYGVTDAQPLDTDLTRIANVSWATGDFVYRDGTGLTNFASTSAGRTLLSAADAAAQRTALNLGAMALKDDAPTNSNAYVRSNGTWAIAGTGGGGGSGTVTSVGLTVPSGFSVSGSPVTTSGTLAVTGVLDPVAGGTGITNLTAAAQVLLAAVDEVDQLTALTLIGGTPTAIDSVARTTVRKNSGAEIGSRRRLNFIEGTNVSLTITDDAGNEELDIIVASTATAGSTNATYTTNYLTVPIFVAGTTNTVASDNTTETNILTSIASWGSTNIALGALTSGSTLRLRAGGTFTDGGDGSGWGGGVFRWKIGGLTVSAQFKDAESFNPSNDPWTLDATLNVVSAGSSATVAVSGGLLYKSADTATYQGAATYENLTFSGTLDTTTTNAVALTFDNASPTTVALVRNTATLEWVGKETILGGGSGSGGSGVQVNGVDGVTNLVDSATATWTKTNGTAAVNIATVSTSGAGLAPQITVSNAVLTASPAGVAVWKALNKQIATWTALENAPGTNASTVARFAIRGDGQPVLVFTNDTALEANFTTWIPSSMDLTDGLQVTLAAYSESTFGTSNVVMQADLTKLCCGGGQALDSVTFTTSGAVTSALPIVASVPTNIVISLPTLTNIAAGDLVRVRLSRVTGSASDINAYNLGVIAAKLEAR